MAYKLMKLRKDGTLGSLFLNAKQAYPVGEWMQAENHKKKGFAERPGWHCTLIPSAPHLSTTGRVWVKVEVDDYATFDRPESQGGKWILANRIKIIEIMENN